MSETFYDSISEGQCAKKFLEEIEQDFSKNEKVDMSNLLAKLISINSGFACLSSLEKFDELPNSKIKAQNFKK
ncbi:hypothetical protein Lal_00000818 [Lupinus albus]|nr:hypothetical protein Lal_00000818 [Lupinus albus]